MTAATTTDLAAFLVARLDEDEAVARRHEGTAYRSWTYVPHTHTLGGSVMPGPLADDWNSGGYVAVAAHIARHDPARVLAEVASKRAIVALHAVDRGDDGPVCAVCAEVSYVDGGVYGDWPCETLCHLASVYASHPDFDESWRV